MTPCLYKESHVILFRNMAGSLYTLSVVLIAQVFRAYCWMHRDPLDKWATRRFTSLWNFLRRTVPIVPSFSFVGMNFQKHKRNFGVQNIRFAYTYHISYNKLPIGSKNTRFDARFLRPSTGMRGSLPLKTGDSGEHQLGCTHPKAVWEDEFPFLVGVFNLIQKY